MDRGDSSGGGATRRDVLKAGAGGALALGGMSALSACGSGSTSTPTSGSAPAGKPQRGGTLTVGMITGGSTETLEVGTGISLSQTCSVYQLYEGLYALDRNNRPALALAEEGESDAKAQTWTMRLRKDVTFHNGQPLTADDVVYTINTWSDEAVNYLAPIVKPVIDFKNVRKRDKYTVEIPLLKPIAEFPSFLSYFTAGIIPNGFKDFSKPIGTGPFKYKSFSAGNQTVFDANKDYWQTGKPYLDSLVINSSFTEESARVNALLAGQVDVLPQLPFTQARQYANGGTIRVSTAEGPQWQGFFFRTDQGVGKDPRVPQAFKYLIDREEMIESVLSGFGSAGNDLAGYSCPYFAKDLKYEHDVEKAVSLLKEAGQENLHLTLKTSGVTSGFIESATILQQQAAQAGVKIDIERIEPGIFFTPAGGYLKNEFSQEYWTLLPSLTTFYLQAMVANAPYNVTHYGSPTSDKLIDEAMAAVDPKQAEERWRAVQELVREDSGYIIWPNEPFIDGYANQVAGIEATPAGFANNYDFKSAWLTA